MKSLGEILSSHGYKLVDDAWLESGRRTYLNDEDANRDFITRLANDLRPQRWVPHPNILRAFLNTVTGEIVEIEMGGSDTSGHFLHQVRV